MYMIVCVSVCMFVCAGYMWRSEVSTRYLSQLLSTLVFETISLTLNLTDAGQLASVILLSRPPWCWDRRHTHTCVASTLATQQCPQPISIYVLVIKKRTGKDIFSVKCNWPLNRTLMEMSFVSWSWLCRAHPYLTRHSLEQQQEALKTKARELEMLAILLW